MLWQVIQCNLYIICPTSSDSVLEQFYFGWACSDGNYCRVFNQYVQGNKIALSDGLQNGPYVQLTELPATLSYIHNLVKTKRYHDKTVTKFRAYPFCLSKAIWAHISISIRETWEECASRETLEETGLSITGVTFDTVINAVIEEEGYHYVVIFMRGEIDLSKQREPENLEPNKCEG